MTDWIDKANEIIASYCFIAWRQANILPTGKLRERHVPYTVPQIAQDLVDCIKRNDEEGAKAAFLFGVDDEGKRIADLAWRTKGK